MLTEIEAQEKIRNFVPNSTLKAWTRYKDLYLIRVEYQSEIYREKIYDPFFSVNINTGEVRDFSILSDLETILNLKWADI